MLKNGLVASRFEVVVVELVPNYYVLIDGAHRCCAWRCILKANPELQKRGLTATVLGANMSWQQVEIVAGGQNGLVSIVPTFLDLVTFVISILQINIFFCKALLV